MFLFTTPASTPTPAARQSAPATPVVDAIRQGAEKTGTGFDYLLATAQRESALDPTARARGSSASGLFQFIDQTWLGLIKSDGPKLGLADQAQAITARSDGTLTVDDPAKRQEILGLRHDPKVAAVMAGVFTQRNRAMLASDLGREPTSADLYVAHVLGSRGAAELIQTAQQTPNRAAATDFPDAAAANKSIFYDKSGRPRGAGEVYGLLASAHAATSAATAGPPAGTTAAPAFAPDRPVAFARQDGPAFHGLFQTETRRGPMSEAVAKLWRTGNGPDGTRTAALSYFPSSSSTAPKPPEAAAPAGVAEPRTDGAPLPPVRPAAAASAAASAAAADAPRRGSARRTGPLDLGAFMKRRGA